jgi:hypothetical protein
VSVARRARTGLHTLRGALLACALATAPGAVAGDAAAAGDSAVPPDVVARLARLDCSRIGATDVREVLARVRAPRIVLGQWTMLSRLRTIPDTVTEFTGFDVPNDPIAGNLLGISPYRASGEAQVRSVVLPAGYSHIGIPRAAHLAEDPRIRGYVESWSAASTAQPPDGDTANLAHAADIWHSVKRHWCLQARRLLVDPAS